MASETPLPPPCQGLADVIAQAASETWRAYARRRARPLDGFALRVVACVAMVTWIAVVALWMLRRASAHTLVSVASLRDDVQQTRSVVRALRGIGETTRLAVDTRRGHPLAPESHGRVCVHLLDDAQCHCGGRGQGALALAATLGAVAQSLGEPVSAIR